MSQFEFFNRELSWIEFNKRVLDEAAQDSNPLLERMKFLSIVSSNFDEFFQVRVASLLRGLRTGEIGGHHSPKETLKEIYDRYYDCTKNQYQVFFSLIQLLAKEKIVWKKAQDLNVDQSLFIKDLFEKELFNILVPVKVEEHRPFPFTANLKLIQAFLIEPLEDTPGIPGADPLDSTKMVVMELPSYIGRLVWLPDQEGRASFILLEDLVSLHAPQLFPGYKMKEFLTFRITRDADIPLDEEREEDFVEAMGRILQSRLHSTPVRLEVAGEGKQLRRRLKESLAIDNAAIFEIPGPVSLKDFMALAHTSGFDRLKVPQWESFKRIPDQEDIWSMIKEKDILLHHPYDSFAPILRLLKEASEDPMVLSIRMTLYRTSGDSPIVQSLTKAAREGKHVTVLVELKARFDEEANIEWAQTLERAGAIVIYGVAGLKVHAKALMIVRRESDGIRRYVHLGTGNYHDKTARLYTDLGILSSTPEFTQEVAQFFNSITGYSTVSKLNYLVVAPHFLKRKVLDMIQMTAAGARQGVSCKITAKMNSLADEDVISALYEASMAGVEIKLNVRGICMLVPGKEFSGNITVVSIVDRYLEHERIYHFKIADRDEVYLSSADWMYRNLEKRVEVLFPVVQKDLKEQVIRILRTYFLDNRKAHRLLPSGNYERLKPENGAPPLRVQEFFHQEALEAIRSSQAGFEPEFEVHRKPRKA